MPSHIEQEQLLNLSIDLINALEQSDFSTFRHLCNNELNASNLAFIIESTPGQQRQLLWQQLSEHKQAEVLVYLPEDIQTSFLKGLSPKEIQSTTSELESDDLTDLLQQLPISVSDQVLHQMPAGDRHDIEVLLAYDENSAGGLMNTNFITVRADIALEVVIRFLRQHRDIPSNLDAVLVTNRNDHFVGMLSLSTIICHAPKTIVREVMNSDVEGIDVNTDSAEVAQLFERHDFVSAPVVSKEGILVGWITIDDVVDVIREQADHTVLSLAGLDEEEDTFSPPIQSAKRRAIWLGINLITALMASSVALIFEHTIETFVALAVLMNITPSMGGIAGSQTLTIVIRGLALGHISATNLNWLLGRELIVGFSNGLLWACVVGIGAYIWTDQWWISVIIGISIWINLIVAVTSGTLLPVFLKRRGIDPALSGSVILTTITDVVGTLIFLGMATLILMT